jgi:hypothetical protein
VSVVERFVTITNQRNRQSLPVGRRTLAGQYAGGKSSARIPLDEFMGPGVRGHVECGWLKPRFADADLAKAWELGGYAELEKILAPVKEAVEAHLAAVEAVPAPVDVIDPAPAPVVEPEPVPAVEPVIAPTAPVEPAPGTAPWTAETLLALPWEGEVTLRTIAKDLGIVGSHTKVKFVDLILEKLEKQEPA